MPLPSFLQRKAPPPAPPKAQRGTEESAQAARVRARRRLIGSAVLLAIAVVVFPLLFESKPRPLPMDTPLLVKPVEVLPATAATAAAAKPGAVQKIEKLPAAGQANGPVAQVAPAVATASAPAVAAPAEPAPVPAPAAAPAPPPASSPSPLPKAPQKTEAAATPASPPAPSPSASASDPKAAARFVVQVGAFADANAAREVRQAVEKLGLKTYTQVIEAEGGKRTRVRVGPFASREEAAKVLARLKGASLPGAVLAL